MRLIGILAAAPIAVALTVLSVPGAAWAENACTQTNPLTAALVRGYAWSGTVLAYHPPARYPDVGTLRFRVEQVYADASGNELLRAGSTVTLPVASCETITRLHVGWRYLVSTSLITIADTTNTVAWQLDGTVASLVVMHPGRKVSDQFQAGTTLAAAVAMVAPDFVLPPTSTGPDPPLWGGIPGVPEPLLVLLVIGAAAAAATRQFDKRRRTH